MDAPLLFFDVVLLGEHIDNLRREKWQKVSEDATEKDFIGIIHFKSCL